ncbi:hypothetical protein D9619_003580 [Psilocybe cf. subviscida]|uniref:Uncharacterized protein n=1 Tax=Psilocybe cf. subviscida TaxID=2480587 RepID=A0A8H5EUU8_9AGAR|nr:hypothetical protein D9619_003580 [Psilocybe cf. subviscida]
MTEPFETSRSSLKFRANLSGLLAPLRRVRSRTPFFALAAHRIPTLWSLYRGLLRAAPDANIRFRVRILFQNNKGWTGVEKTQESLRLGYKWLDFFRRAQAGDEHCRKVMTRFSSLVGVKMEKAYMMRFIRANIEARERFRHRPILTGAFMRPSVNFVGLPRMKPQPPSIGHLIVGRILKRNRRYERKAVLEDHMKDLRLEDEFEQGLQREVKQPLPTYFSEPQEWTRPIKEMVDDINSSNRQEYKRQTEPYTRELIERVIEARRQRIRFHTEMKDRERRGEVTKGSSRRQNQGPPAHILRTMSPKQRRLDKVSRSLSEVGYTALVKRKLGFKLKDPDAGLELGEKRNQPLLDEAAELIHAENKRRQQAEEKLMAEQARNPRSSSPSDTLPS